MLRYKVLQQKTRNEIKTAGLFQKKIEEMRKFAQDHGAEKLVPTKEFKIPEVEVFFEMEIELARDYYIHEISLFPSCKTFHEKVIAKTSLITKIPTHKYKILFKPQINGEHNICVELSDKNDPKIKVSQQRHLIETIFVPFAIGLDEYQPTKIMEISQATLGKGMALREDKQLFYLTDHERNEVIAINKKGEKFVFYEHVRHPISLALGPDNNWLAVISPISIYTLECNDDGLRGQMLQAMFTDYGACYTDVAISPIDRNIYVTQFELRTINVYSEHLIHLKYISIIDAYERPRSPGSIAIDTKGVIYVYVKTRSFIGQIYRYNREGEIIARFDTNFEPQALACSPLDNYLYGIRQDKGIITYTEEGQLADTWKLMLRTENSDTRSDKNCIVENPIGVIVTSKSLCFSTQKGKIIIYHRENPVAQAPSDSTKKKVSFIIEESSDDEDND